MYTILVLYLIALSQREAPEFVSVEPEVLEGIFDLPGPRRPAALRGQDTHLARLPASPGLGGISGSKLHLRSSRALELFGVPELHHADQVEVYLMTRPLAEMTLGPAGGGPSLLPGDPIRRMATTPKEAGLWYGVPPSHRAEVTKRDWSRDPRERRFMRVVMNLPELGEPGDDVFIQPLLVIHQGKWRRAVLGFPWVYRVP
jgi:hypothetical protein